MQITIYGSSQCPDTQACLKACREKGVAHEFKDIGDLAALKEFIGIRDREALFDPVKKAGGMGIPLIRKEDGAYTLDWEAALGL